jgi:hypothetical protein
MSIGHLNRGWAARLAGFFAMALALLLGATTLAQETSMEDLRLAPASRQVPTGRVGDRAIVVFVGPGDLAGAVRVRC